VILLVGVFFLLAVPGAIAETRTYDEFLHYRYGYRILTQQNFARGIIFNAEMPVAALQVAPAYVNEKLGGQPVYAKDDPFQRYPGAGALILARLVTVAFAVALGFALAALAFLLGGRGAMLATAFLFAFDPNLLTHARYVTNDMPVTLATVLVVTAALLLARRPNAGRAALLGAAIGLSLLAKYTAIHVIFGLAISLAILAARRMRAPTAEPAPAAAGPSRARLLGLGVVVVVLACFVVDAGYGFQGVPGRFTDPPESASFARIIATLGRPPLPVPTRFLDGIDGLLYAEKSKETFGPFYILGDLDVAKNGWPYYYLVVCAFKLPIPLIILVAIAALGLAGRGPAAPASRENRVADLVVLPVLLEMLVYFGLFFRVQIGIRYLLPTLALFLPFAGRALAELLAGSRRARVLGLVLAGWQAVSVLSFAPRFLPYVNELIPDRKMTYRTIADSNVDWGQADGEAESWCRLALANGVDVHLRPEKPVAGTIVVPVNELVGIMADPARYAWLRSKRPVSQIGYSYLVFDVKPGELR
jgi:hypothetical protein